MTEIPDLALERYCEFVESFNKLKLVEYELDTKTFNYADVVKTFYEKISTNDQLFKYLLNREKLLFHKKYKVIFLHKINLYNFI